MPGLPGIEVMHGVNLDVLELRDQGHYGGLSLTALEQRIASQAWELGVGVGFFQTNSEGEFVERLHEIARRVRDSSERRAPGGLILNPGAWTHYSWAIHDALEIVGLPAVEVHLSDLSSRESFRQVSVVRDLCLTTIAGRGLDGYGEALARLKAEIEGSG